jgi:hypothetical protein
MPLVAFNDPTAIPASFLILEAGVLAAAAFSLWHARRDPARMLTWLTILIYGVAMEIISYELVDNFAHGQFTVMLYDRQLPLYITAVYQVLLYTGITLARRLRLPPAPEALAAGALIVAIDAPYDLAGPRLGWWRWFDGHPEIAHRWAGVPVTSFYWHLAFGAILCAITAAAARRRAPLATAPLLAAATIVLGMLAFAPFHLLVATGVSDGVVVGGALCAAVAVALVAALRR